MTDGMSVVFSFVRMALFFEHVRFCRFHAMEKSLIISSVNKKKRILFESSFVEEKKPRWPLRAWFFIRTCFRGIYLTVLFSPVVILGPFAYFFETLRDSWFVLLKQTISYAGPMYIKAAQWASSRPDLFPEALIERLATFQYSSPTHSIGATFHILSKANVNLDVFESIDSDCVGSGAVGQVHRATLKKNSKSVAIKVLHQGVRDMVKRDLALLDFLAKTLTFLIPSTYYYDLKGVVEAFGDAMTRQLDLKIEAEHLKRFREEFAGRKGVRFPQVYFCTHDVMVMSYEEGNVLTDVLNGKAKKTDAQKKHIAKTGLSVFLEMIDNNFIHGDLHPGNILVDGEDIVILDCGIVIELSQRNAKNFKSLLRALAFGDGVLGAKLMLENSVGSHCKDSEGFQKEMQLVFEQVTAARTFGSAPLGNALQQVLHLSQKYQVRLESAFVTLITSCIVLEGSGRALYSDLSLFSAVKKILKD